ncbi:hypothetical protein J3R83DRAFT_11416, partial [Lanmaoa asiatica]
MSSYDQNLLDEAPRATRAQLQEGYNVDLLEQPPRRMPSVRSPLPQTPQPAPLTVPLTPGIAETGLGEKLGAPTPAASKPRTSFWRSRNGIIAIVLIVLIVIGAVVGGAVGGTVKKSSNNSVSTTGTGSTSSSGSSALPITPVSNSSEATATSANTQGVGGGRPTPSEVSPSPTSTAQNIQTAAMRYTGKR